MLDEQPYPTQCYAVPNKFKNNFFLGINITYTHTGKKSLHSNPFFRFFMLVRACLLLRNGRLKQLRVVRVGVLP